MLDVNDAACAKYFTMMWDGPARTWLKGLPPNSIRSWAELKTRFIQNFKDTCKQPMSILDLDSCVQGEGDSTTNWVRQISAVALIGQYQRWFSRSNVGKELPLPSP